MQQSKNNAIPYFIAMDSEWGIANISKCLFISVFFFFIFASFLFNIDFKDKAQSMDWIIVRFLVYGIRTIMATLDVGICKQKRNFILLVTVCVREFAQI